MKKTNAKGRPAVFFAVILVSLVCSCTYYRSSEYVGEYRIDFSYTYYYFTASGWQLDTAYTTDTSCFIIAASDGSLTFSDFNHFSNEELPMSITGNEIEIPTYVLAEAGLQPITYSAEGTISGNTFNLNTHRSSYDWSLGFTVQTEGYAVGTKIN